MGTWTFLGDTDFADQTVDAGIGKMFVGDGIFIGPSGALNDVSFAGELVSVTSVWDLQSAAEEHGWTDLAYGNGIFVATTNANVMSSPDGIVWTMRTAAEANYWYSITYGNGLFVAVALSGTNRVMTSPDGITWTARSVPANPWTGINFWRWSFRCNNFK